MDNESVLPEVSSAFIARQPIVDEKQNIVAYELLFRSSQSQKMEILDDVTATCQVLINTINSIGIEKVLDGKLGFVNMNEHFFKTEIHESLDGSQFVLEILEHTVMTPELIDQLIKMSEEGYVLALDDFIFQEDMIEIFKPIFPYIKILKIDLAENDLNELEEKMKLFKGYSIKFLAEKVETMEEFKLCKKIGFSYFQGYFFSKPEIMEGKRVDPSAMAVMELIRGARSSDVTNKLESEFKRFPDITVNFLRYVNSADQAFRSKITSVRHGLNLIGKQKLIRWLTLMLYAKPGMTQNSSPLLVTASQRANLIESTLKLIGRDSEEELNQAYLTGVLSLMDVVFHVEMKQLLSDLSVDPDIVSAIIDHKGIHGQLLELVIAAETQNFDRVSELLIELEIDREDFAKVLYQSYESPEMGI